MDCWPLGKPPASPGPACLRGLQFPLQSAYNWTLPQALRKASGAQCPSSSELSLPRALPGPELVGGFWKVPEGEQARAVRSRPPGVPVVVVVVVVVQVPAQPLSRSEPTLGGSPALLSTPRPRQPAASPSQKDLPQSPWAHAPTDGPQQPHADPDAAPAPVPGRQTPGEDAVPTPPPAEQTPEQSAPEEKLGADAPLQEPERLAAPPGPSA